VAEPQRHRTIFVRLLGFLGPSKVSGCWSASRSPSASSRRSRSSAAASSPGVRRSESSSTCAMRVREDRAPLVRLLRPWWTRLRLSWPG